MKVHCKSNSDKGRFYEIDVAYTLTQIIKYIVKGKEVLNGNNQHDAMIILKIAFHLTKVLKEGRLTLRFLTLLLSSQYHLFRVILSLKYAIEDYNEVELSRFAPIQVVNERPLILPKVPEKIQSEQDDAIKNALKAEITRPTIPLACVIGQEIALNTIVRELIMPYKQPKAIKHDMPKKGVLLYGPAGNGKEVYAIKNYSCISVIT